MKNLDEVHDLHETQRQRSRGGGAEIRWNPRPFVLSTNMVRGEKGEEKRVWEISKDPGKWE